MDLEYEVDHNDVWNLPATTVAHNSVVVSVTLQRQDKASDDHNSSDAVVIASKSESSSITGSESCRGGGRPGTRNKVLLRMTDSEDDKGSGRHHVIKLNGRGGRSGPTSTANNSTLRCDRNISSDTHRLKMNQEDPEQQQHQHHHHGGSRQHRHHHRGNAFRLAGSLKSILLVTWMTVFLLGGGVPAVAGTNNNNQRNGGDDAPQESNLGSRNTKLFGDLSVMEDINLIDQEEDLPPLGNNNGNEEGDLGNQQHYTHQWAVHILGGPQVARKVAEKHGFEFHGEIFQDYYHLTHARVAKRSIEAHVEYHERLASEPEVRWIKQQTIKSRKKRDFLPEPLALSTQGNGGGGKSGRRRAARRSKSIVLNDPRWPAMWYLNRGGGLDMNVLEAWNDGITGKGIVVTILDDGLEKDHPDIVRNYDPMASFDVNSLDMDPMPTYDLTDSNRHGTRCAGEVAAEANNSICAVGIAFEAGVGGVRMLDGDVTDAVEARSLSHNPQHIDIYSASWGPDDDGKTVDGPGELATRAFMEGVAKGRSGRGSIFVWASGNGGRDHDNCNCDGYTNSIWTLSISSATENGFVPWYSEACSSTLATTYSSGGTGEKQIVTIDLHHSCTSSHTGTSASAPLAAGICALALQANMNLTWRDMQHIVVRTARPQHLVAGDWATNGVGRNVSHSFGYGLMDAGAMVKLSKKWKTVPQQHKCEIKAPYTDKNIPSKSKVTLDLKVTNCPNVNYLEHVQAKVTLTSGRRGDLQIFLVSPAGTRSQLLAHRRHDLNRAGFTDWPFMTVHSWGESPIGKWTLEIHNEGRYTDGKGRTVLKRWSLVMYGTEVDVNTNYSGRGNSNSTTPSILNSQEGQQHGFSSFILYTPRNSSAINKPGFENGEGGGKGDSGGNGGKSKGQRQRQKGKLISKKQKGATPTVKPPPAPSESHVIITSDDEEFQQFLQSKFGLMRLTSSVVVGRSDGRNAKGNSNSNRTEDVNNAHHTLVPITRSEKEEPKDNDSSGLSSSSSSSTLIRASSREGGQEESSSTLGIGTTTTQSPPFPINFNSTSASTTNAAADATSTVRAVTSNGNPFSPPISSESLTTNRNGMIVNSIVERTDPGFQPQPLHRLANGSKTATSSTSQESPAPSSASFSSSIVANNQSQIEQGKMQTWSLIAHGISTNPNDLAGGSGTGGGGSFVGGAGLQQNGDQGQPAAPAVVEQFDGSDNTIAAESSSSLQNSGAPPAPAHAGVAKPVSIVGRPSAPAQSTASTANCAKMSKKGQCLVQGECVPGLALLHSGCVSQCPNTFYVESRGHPSLKPESEDSASAIHYVCMPCHYSCQTCSGPDDDECVTCYGDARLHRVSVESDPATSTDKAHCYPVDLMNSLDKSDLSHRILLAIIAVSTVFILCMLALFCCDCCRRNSHGKGGGFKDEYDRGGHDHSWLGKAGQSRPYKRISPEELDDDDEEYEYFDAYRQSKGKMGRKFHNNQTHLELISEDEEGEEGEDDFEQLVPPDNSTGRGGTLNPSITAGVHGQGSLSPRGPIDKFSSSSSSIGSSKGNNSREDPLV